MQKTKHQVENEIEYLVQNQRVERNKYIIRYFGKNEPGFVFNSSKSYGGLKISPNVQQIIDKYNQGEDLELKSTMKSKFKEMKENIFESDEYKGISAQHRIELNNLIDQLPAEDHFLGQTFVWRFSSEDDEKFRNRTKQADSELVYGLIFNAHSLELDKQNQDSFVAFTQAQANNQNQSQSK